MKRRGEIMMCKTEKNEKKIMCEIQMRREKNVTIVKKRQSSLDKNRERKKKEDQK